MRDIALLRAMVSTCRELAKVAGGARSRSTRPRERGAKDCWPPVKAVTDQMRANGFELLKEHAFLPYQYFLVFTPARPASE